MAEITKSFSRIWEPRVTGIPPTNAHRDLMMLPDGQVRHYGYRVFQHDGQTRIEAVVQVSDDYGLNWRERTIDTPTPGATVVCPWSGDYVTVLHNKKSECDDQHINPDSAYSILDACNSDGVYFIRSHAGPEGPFSITRIFPEPLYIQRQPLALKSRKRWLQPFQAKREDGFIHPGVLWSDDDGRTWDHRVLPYPPLHEIKWPHKGFRWRQPGSEPVIAECPSGKLIMLLRTSLDTHYQCISDDGGENWTVPEPARFYSVATSPNLLALSDGRLLAIWNNTTPLPEFDHDLQAGLTEDERKGEWEDVFTNRDALHAAISDDEGRTWRGFRELHLNVCRNDGDFRSGGGSLDCLDKSVHQTQALELPEGKVLVALGQHARCRKYLIFDVRWLDETRRADDFTQGLGDWSVHQYLKSLSGGYRGIVGHCAFNRLSGASLIPHPDGIPREVLQIGRHPDSRLIFEKQGAVWNFPASRRGTVTLRLSLRAGSPGMRIGLVDRWFNPVDPVVAHFSPFVFDLDSAGGINQCQVLRPDSWVDLSLEWDQDAGVARFLVDNKPIGETECGYQTENGISYLYLQSTAEGADPFGVLIESANKV